MKAAMALAAIAAATAGLLWLAQPQTRTAYQPAYCMGEQTAELCRDMDLRNKTEFRA